MRILFIILLFSVQANAGSKYYLSNTGSNGANGTSTGTAWQTIAFAMSTMVSGDSLLLKKGDSWNEKMTIPASNIYIGSYSTGNKPIITGFQNLSMSDQGGNIWQGTATNAALNLRVVKINDSIRAKGRYPNNGYMSFTSYTGNYQINTSLTGTPDYTGAEVAVKSWPWIIDVSKIQSQSTGVLTLYPGLTYTSGGNSFFLQNLPSLLDTLHEWCVDSTTKVLKVYATSLPTVQYSNLDTVIYSTYNSLTFDGIEVSGGNTYNFKVSGEDITIKNCLIKDGFYGIYGNNGGIGVKDILIDSDSLTNLNNDGVFIVPDTFAVISNNYLRNIAIFPGMGGNGELQYIGLFNQGHDPHYYNNQLINVGYIPIYWKGRRSILEYNYIDSFGTVKTDGGGIYTYAFALPYFDTGSIVRYNIIKNGLGTQSIGIYLDDAVIDVDVTYNTIYNTNYSGIFVNGNSHSFLNNTVYNIYYPGWTLNSAYVSGTLGFTIRNNIFYKTTELYQGQPFKYNGNRDTTEDIDYNFYLLPGFPNASIANGNDIYTLPNWQAFIKNDYNSSVSFPAGISSTTPLLKYNASLSTVNQSLTGTYYDVYGNHYTNMVSLAPFTSKLLFKATVNDNTNILQKLRFRRVVD